MDRKEFKNRLHYGEEVTVHINKGVFSEAILSSLNRSRLEKILPKHKILQEQVKKEIDIFLKNIKKVVVDINNDFRTFYFLIQSRDNSAICFSYKDGVSNPAIDYLSCDEKITDYYNTKLFTLGLENYINFPNEANNYELTEIFGLGKVLLIKNKLKHNTLHSHKFERHRIIQKTTVPKNKVKTFNTLMFTSIVLTLFSVYTIIQFSDSEKNITSIILR